MGASTPGFGDDDACPHPLGAWYLAGLPRAQPSPRAVTAHGLRLVIDGCHPAVWIFDAGADDGIERRGLGQGSGHHTAFRLTFLSTGHADLFGGGQFTPQCVGAESRRSHLAVSFCANRVSFGLVLP